MAAMATEEAAVAAMPAATEETAVAAMAAALARVTGAATVAIALAAAVAKQTGGHVGATGHGHHQHDTVHSKPPQNRFDRTPFQRMPVRAENAKRVVAPSLANPPWRRSPAKSSLSATCGVSEMPPRGCRLGELGVPGNIVKLG